MANQKEKLKEQQELGFGNKNYKESVRFITKDGRLNVKREGLGGFRNFDIYHWLINVNKLQLALVILLGYIMINMLFAGIYFMIGPENFGGINMSTKTSQFMDLFFFSAQTVTTLGYGHIYPIGNGASIAAAAESLLGLLSFAIATGVLFGRFSRPQAHLLYSKQILIAPYKNITGLMFRVANKKQYELIEAEANINLSINNPETGRREFFSLKLEINRINFLALSWTIVHPINEESPLFGLSLDALKERDAEIIILLKATNDTYSQTVYSRYSYKSHDFIEKAKFRPLKQEPNKKGQLRISVTDIHLYDNIS